MSTISFILAHEQWPTAMRGDVPTIYITVPYALVPGYEAEAVGVAADGRPSAGIIVPIRWTKETGRLYTFADTWPALAVLGQPFLDFLARHAETDSLSVLAEAMVTELGWRNETVQPLSEAEERVALLAEIECLLPDLSLPQLRWLRGRVLRGDLMP